VADEQVAALDPQAVHTPFETKYPALQVIGTGPIQLVEFPGHG